MSWIILNRDWKKQTTIRMPESIRKRVFHRGQLKKFLKS